MLFIAYTQALFHIKTSTEQKIIFISSLFFSSINYLITLFLPLSVLSHPWFIPLFSGFFFLSLLPLFLLPMLPLLPSLLPPGLSFTFHLSFSVLSAEARPRGLQVRQRPGGGGCSAEWEVLHPAAGGHRDLLVHVEVHPWPQVPTVGLGSSTGKEIRLCINISLDYHFD